ncbi:MAG: hypothetical protein Kow0042_02770 [Calditrichia bacterium]
MMNQENQSKTLIEFFRQTLKRTFVDLDLLNFQVLEYIASLLARFARTENLYRIKQIPHFKLESVVETLLQVEMARRGEETMSERDEILLRQHIGDFTLFMSGIFREYVQRLGFLNYYLYEGGRSYGRVYDYAYQEYGPGAMVFRDLSRQFEQYSGALDYMKKVYFYYPRIDDEIRSVLKKLLSLG